MSLRLPQSDPFRTFHDALYRQLATEEWATEAGMPSDDDSASWRSILSAAIGNLVREGAPPLVVKEYVARCVDMWADVLGVSDEPPALDGEEPAPEDAETLRLEEHTPGCPMGIAAAVEKFIDENPGALPGDPRKVH